MFDSEFIRMYQQMFGMHAGATRSTRREPQTREERALVEMHRICKKATDEGWKIAEETADGKIEMTFVNQRTGKQIKGDKANNRKAALASACGAMQATGF